MAPLAAALRVDPAQLFMLVLKDWFSECLLDQIYDNMLALPAAEPELSWVRALRTIFDGKIPPMTDEIRSRLETALASVERRRGKKFD